MPLTATGLGHHFAGRPWFFRGLNFDAVEGEVVSLIGPSGSGKSTLLGVIAGQVAPAEGIVERPLGRVAWVFQNPHGVPERQALDHVCLPLLACGTSIAEAEALAMCLLERLGIAHVADEPFASLSGGEAQRLMLARALAAGPALLLVDEPTAQLDPASAKEVAGVLNGMAGSGTIVVVATHDMEVAASCTRVLDLAGCH